MEVVWRWRVLALFKMDFIRILDMDFIEERISRKAFWEIVKFNYPTHQIVFCTDEALKTLKFEGSYSL